MTAGGLDRRLPAGDEIFLDHVAHFVADADAAARALAQAGFTTTPQSIQVNPDRGRRAAAADRHRQRHGDARPRLHRVPVQDRGYAARQAVRYGDGPLPRAASRRLRGGGRRRHPCAARDRRLRAAAGRRHAAAGRDPRRRGHCRVLDRAAAARRDAGGAHPGAHPPHREHGVAGTLARPSQRRDRASSTSSSSSPMSARRPRVSRGFSAAPRRSTGSAKASRSIAAAFNSCRR